MFHLTGLLDAAVNESYDRIKAAMQNIGYRFPQADITVNLSPADLRKEGSGYDLPLAVSILAADGAWDGKVWLHGAVAWRMQLNGWRAGYLGDVLGMPERALSHFSAYAGSQVTDVPPTIPNPTSDPEKLFSREQKKWGTQMYSNGYICRYPDRKDVMRHYDMNLNYIDELLMHFQYDADKEFL